MADVSRPLLGADFLRHYNLLVDVRRQQLVHSETLKTIPLHTSGETPLRLHAITQGNCIFARLLAGFPDITEPTFTSVPKHGVLHYIPTTGPPVRARARRLAPEGLRLAREEFDKMLKMGICRRSNSQYSSPVVMVDKADGTKRPCGDYTALNGITTPDRYPVPHIQDFAANLAGKRVFSKVDLVRGYHQIPMALEDIPKTALITPFGLFEFLRMPFGLRNAAQTFQRLMDSVCAGLDFTFVYLDDILVASRNKEEHLEHLRLLFSRLRDHGLSLNPAKCRFGATTIDFLGHRIDSQGALPLPDKVEVIKAFPKPTTTKGLQEFTGMVTFYHRFVPSAARLMRPLYRALSGKKPKTTQNIIWNTDMESAFEATKSALSDAVMLAHPVAEAPVYLTTDASDLAVGAVLQQLVRGQLQPLAFFSKQLRPPELKYSAYDRELLAIYLSIKHFNYYLEGQPVTVFTDHKPLTFAHHSTSAPMSKRQQHHLSFISKYTTDIQHVAGRDNTVADALSRATVHSIQACLDFEEMARDQQADPDVQAYRTAITSLRLEDVAISPNTTLLCDVSTNRQHPIVPSSWRQRVFDAIHGLSHPGITTTCRLVASKFVWHGLNKEVRTWA